MSLVKHFLERGWDLCSECHVSRLHQDVWLRVPARHRVRTLRQLKARGWWKELPPRGRSGAPLIPRTPRSVGCWNSCRLCRAKRCRPTLVSLGANASPSSGILKEACDAKANHRGRGVMNAMDVGEKKNERESPEIPVLLAWMTVVRDQVVVVETNNMAHLVLSQGGTTIANLVRFQHKSVSSVACFRHRLGHSAAATWFGPTCCLLLQRISTW